MKAFTDLEVWQRSRVLRNDISQLTKSFPSEEKYRLSDQIIRSSRSVGNNIAEGHGRFHYIDSSRFLITARGSLIETLDHLIVALDEKYITEEIFNKFKGDYETCLRMLNGYITYLRNQQPQKNG
ncbi:four helix bundle protein [Mucilaginibacter antarcticus]|uniref:Four helix bundle protein n=1 Tax=Mucilaginibacter antarcticus TaxID=1855725 RepID=A0ABW5XSE4_9SPHI